jgi:hypothetical protein
LSQDIRLSLTREVNRDRAQRTVKFPDNFLRGCLGLEKRRDVRHHVIQHQVIPTQEYVVAFAGQRDGGFPRAHFFHRLVSQLGQVLRGGIPAEECNLPQGIVFVDAEVFLGQQWQFPSTRTFDDDGDLHEAGLYLEDGGLRLSPALSGGRSQPPERLLIKLTHRDRSLENLGGGNLRRSLGNIRGIIAHVEGQFPVIFPEIRQETARAAGLGIKTSAAMNTVFRVRKRDFDVVPAAIEGNLCVVIQHVGGAQLGGDLGKCAAQVARVFDHIHLAAVDIGELPHHPFERIPAQTRARPNGINRETIARGSSHHDIQ